VQAFDGRLAPRGALVIELIEQKLQLLLEPLLAETGKRMSKQTKSKDKTKNEKNIKREIGTKHQLTNPQAQKQNQGQLCNLKTS
jgi:hypothetical protein